MIIKAAPLRGYAVINRWGEIIPDSFRKERWLIVLWWTNGFKSEKCKAWKRALKKGIRIVRAELKEI